MEAISNRTGRTLHGKIAEILVRKGSAIPVGDPDEPETEVVEEVIPETPEEVPPSEETIEPEKEEVIPEPVAEKPKRAKAPKKATAKKTASKRVKK